MKTLAVMLYDGDCGFCRRRVDVWEKSTDGFVLYEPYQQALARFPQVRQEQCREAVQLIMPDGTVFSGACAVLQALALGGRYKRLLWCYRRVPFFGQIAEWCYRLVARHRHLLSKLSHAPQCRIK